MNDGSARGPRLDPEVFRLPVEKIRGGWYSDAYFNFAKELLEAARGKQILFFPARHDHWLVQTGDGWAAHVAGAIGVSTDAQASWWGGRGVGTVPHALIAAYGGDTVAAAQAFAARFADHVNVTVLVDFQNDSVATALAVAEALGERLWGVRLDTSGTLVDRAAIEEMQRLG